MNGELEGDGLGEDLALRTPAGISNGLVLTPSTVDGEGNRDPSSRATVVFKSNKLVFNFVVEYVEVP